MSQPAGGRPKRGAAPPPAPAGAPPAAPTEPAAGRFEVTLKALLLRDGAALVLRDRVSGKADLPGGRITQAELHRPWIDALRREITEELGAAAIVEVEGEPLFSFPHVLPTSRGDAVGMMWIGQWTGGELTLSSEHDQWEFVPLAQVADRFVETLAPAVARACEVAPQHPGGKAPLPPPAAPAPLKRKYRGAARFRF